jgi:hypothetical protein
MDETILRKPLNLPVVVPLEAVMLPHGFDAPDRIVLSEITTEESLEPATEPESNRIRATVVDSYAKTHDLAASLQKQLLEEGNTAIQRLVDAYHFMAMQVPNLLLQADEQLTSPLENAKSQVISAAETADQTIVDQFKHAKQQLDGATGEGLAAVQENARTAQQQINTIIDNLASGFVDILSEATIECERESVEAYDNIGNWKNNFNRLHPIGDYGLKPAIHEAYRKVVPKLATTAQTQLSKHTTHFQEKMLQRMRNERRTITNAVNPALQTYAQQIGTQGVASVNNAHQTAMKGLRQQTSDARQAVRDMRRNTLQQLEAHREEKRAQLETEAQQTVASLRREASTAVDTVSNSLTQSLPHYASSTQRFHDMLVTAKNPEPEALQAMADAATPSVHGSLQEAYDIQREQVNTITTSVPMSLESQLQQTNATLKQHVAEGSNQIQTSALEAIKRFNTTANRMTAGFANVTDGVNAAIETWSKPLADHFSQVIETKKKEIETILKTFKPEVNTDKQKFLDWIKPRKTPESFQGFKESLDSARASVFSNIWLRVGKLGAAFNAGKIDRQNESAVTAALMGLTRAQGVAMKWLWQGVHKKNLEQDLKEKLAESIDDNNNYLAAISYLNGNTAAGAQYELKASMHWYGDDEDRIKRVMRSLTKEQLQQMHTLPGWAETVNDVRSALDETALDLNVFNALNAGNHAKADAYEMLDEAQRARKQGDDDALNAKLASYSQAPNPEQYGGQTITGDQRRQAMLREAAAILGHTTDEQGKPLSNEAAAEAVVAHVTRPIELTRRSGHGQRGQPIMLKVEDRQKALAHDLLVHGEGSVEARVSRLGVEMKRRGGAKALNLDTALTDPRLNPNNKVSTDERQVALKERQAVISLAAKRYGSTASASQNADTARAELISQLRGTYDKDSAGADLAEMLVRDEHPTPATAAVAMQFAMEGFGTDEALMARFSGRMNRDELQDMVRLYEVDGRNFYADVGLFGKAGWRGELSSDDRLDMQARMLGKPRNKREQAEVSAYAMHQQLAEAGDFGNFLMSNTYQERFLKYNKQQLRNLVGAEITFDENGVPHGSRTENFDSRGNYKGDTAEFSAITQGSQLSARQYSAAIDQYADFATNTITALGTIGAAALTIATGGAASPLLMAAIAGGTGVSSMGLKATLKGGRYGWEEGVTDLGMTAVQALTAGVGQGLGLAARGGTQGLQASLRTGTNLAAARKVAQDGLLNVKPSFLKNVLIGSAGGALSSLGQTALSEQTYAQGSGKAFENLLFSMLRGAASGAATGTVSNAIEGIPSLNKVTGESTSMIGRGLGKSVSGAAGGYAGRATELGLDSARGTYRGDAGAINIAAFQAGLQSGIQSFGEGAGESWGQRRFNASLRTAQGDPLTTDTSDSDAVTSPPARSPDEDIGTLPPDQAYQAADGSSSPPLIEPYVSTPPQRAIPAGAHVDPQETVQRPAPATPQVGDGGDTPRRLTGGDEGDGDGRRRPSRAEAERDLDILDTMLATIQERRMSSPSGGLVDDDVQNLPGPIMQRIRAGEGAPGRSIVPPNVKQSLRKRARHAFGRMLQAALNDESRHTLATRKSLDYMTPANQDYVRQHGRLPQDFDFDHFLTVADFPEFAHRGDVGLALPRDVHREAAHGGDPGAPREAAAMLDPDAETRRPFNINPDSLEDTTGYKPREQLVAEALRESGDQDYDTILGQRAELARMRARATRMRRSRQTDPADLRDLEHRIEQIVAGIQWLEQQRAARGTPDEAQPPARIRVAVPEEEPNLTTPTEGAAAGIAGSRFRGDASETARPHPDVHQDIRQAVYNLTSTDLQRTSRVSAFAVSNMTAESVVVRTGDVGETEVLIIPRASDKEVTVRIVVTDPEQMPRDKNGEIPPARFELSGDDEYRVSVSSATPPEAVERALAHEFTEIRHVHGREATAIPDDFLTTGTPSENAQRRRGMPEFSPHDKARIAELDVLAQQLEFARAVSDQPGAHRTQEEIQKLLSHLGLLEDSPEAYARLRAVRAEVELLPLIDVGASAVSPLQVLDQQITTAHLAEFDSLAAQMAQARMIGDERNLLQFQDRMQRILAQLNVIDNTPEAQARLQTVRDQLADRPAVLQILHEQVAAAERNPFLRQPPQNARELSELLADRLHYARSIGDETRVRQVLNHAQQIIRLIDNNQKAVIDFQGNNQAPVVYSTKAVSKIANAPAKHRAAALTEIFEHVQRVRNEESNRSKSPTARDPMQIDPDTAAAVQRQHGDHRLFQDWDEFAARFGIGSGSTREEIHAAFDYWADGHYINVTKPLSLTRSSRVPDIEARFIQGEKHVARPDITLPEDTTEATRLQRIMELQAQHERETSLAKREEISDELAKLPSLRRASEDLGEAAAKNFAKVQFGVDDGDIATRRSSGVPDLMFEDPATGRLVIIEAKGGDSGLVTRRSVDGDQRVQQGTVEYLESLAKSMQRSSDPEIRRQGELLEVQLKLDEVDYYLVQQTYERSDGTLEVPTVSRFDMSQGGRPRSR